MNMEPGIQKNRTWFAEQHVNLYDTKIYYSMLQKYELVGNELKEPIESSKWEMRESCGETHYLSNASSKNNFLIDNNCKVFLQELDYHLEMYCKLHNYPFKKFSKNYVIKESWASKFEPGNYSPVHSHATADIVGVYYYKRVGESKSGDIFFHSPVCGHTANPLYSKDKHSFMYFPEGTLVLFPGYLEHGVKTNETEEDQISISFNVKLL